MKTEEQVVKEWEELSNAFDCNTEEPRDAQFLEGEVDGLEAVLTLRDAEGRWCKNAEDKTLAKLEIEKEGVMKSMGYIRRLEWVLDVEDKGWCFWEEDE